MLPTPSKGLGAVGVVSALLVVFVAAVLCKRQLTADLCRMCLGAGNPLGKAQLTHQLFPACCMLQYSSTAEDEACAVWQHKQSLCTKKQPCWAQECSHLCMTTECTSEWRCRQLMHHELWLQQQMNVCCSFGVTYLFVLNLASIAALHSPYTTATLITHNYYTHQRKSPYSHTQQILCYTYSGMFACI